MYEGGASATLVDLCLRFARGTGTYLWVSQLGSGVTLSVMLRSAATWGSRSIRLLRSRAPCHPEP